MNEYTDPCFDQSALITIDTQNDFTLENAPLHIKGTADAVPNMVKLLDLYRAKKQLIIHVVRLYLADGSNAELCRREQIRSGTRIVAPGTNGAELVDALKPDNAARLDTGRLLSGDFQQTGSNEFIMYKPRWGAFYQTGLQAFLAGRGITTLVFTGCNFPNCPRASIYEASERDFRIALVKDAVSMLDPQGEKEMEDIGVEIFTTAQLHAFIT